jgi:hypothetical protein
LGAEVQAFGDAALNYLSGPAKRGNYLMVSLYCSEVRLPWPGLLPNLLYS